MSEPSMIERVARALHARKYGEWYEGPLKMTDSQRACLADARAAIEAMRDPTDAMTKVAADDILTGPGIGAFLNWQDLSASRYRLMIDAALNEGKQV